MPLSLEGIVQGVSYATGVAVLSLRTLYENHMIRDMEFLHNEFAHGVVTFAALEFGYNHLYDLLSRYIPLPGRAGTALGFATLLNLGIELYQSGVMQGTNGDMLPDLGRSLLFGAVPYVIYRGVRAIKSYQASTS